MALARILFLILLSKFSYILSAPATNSSMDANSQNSEFNSLHLSQHLSVQMDEVNTLLLFPQVSPTWTSSTPASKNSQADGGQFGLSFSFVPTSPLSTEAPETVTVTKEEPTTITLSGPQITITEVITATGTLSPTPTSAPGSSNPGKGAVKDVWETPKDMTNLDSFGITKFAGGQNNLKIVGSIPAKASAASFGESAEKDGSSSQRMDDRAAMQLFYPESSINPAQVPVGGAEFYASPIDISSARNVTLSYSVFFPADFDWVLAGKLPGLYGGHTGCSGGNAALDCFSTRLMWRTDGAGELYLYAPKDKQTDALCTAQGSVCDAAYGLSIGRGSFTWAAGAWTTIHQTVYLNTPGEQDGVFTLDVNGQTAIYRKDVFYREDLSGGGGSGGKTAKPTRAPTKTTRRSKPTSTTPDDGGLLGPILGGLVDRMLDGRRREEAGDVRDRELRPKQQESLSPSGDAPMISGILQSTAYASPQPTVADLQPTETGTSNSSAFGIQSAKPKEVKFAGIFFSTFFGGHEDKYATPRDQYVWFRDFALAYNF